MSSSDGIDVAKRNAYLKALGLQQWRMRDVVIETDSLVTDVSCDNQDKSNQSAQLAGVQTNQPQVTTHTELELSNNANQAVVDWQKISTLDMASLQMEVRACQACELHKTRKQTVFGTGHNKADWLIIGEAPGADEDRQGEPFVGRAGQLLTQMLRAIGLAREEVFIANILKCRPPNNRDPKIEEVQACQSYLHRQIELLEPKIILALGRIAAHSLLNSATPIGKMRGKLYHLEKYNIPLVVTYHPAYLLRSPKEKRKVWEDLKFARQQVVH